MNKKELGHLIQNQFRYSMTQLHTPTGYVLIKIDHETGQTWYLKGEQWEKMKD